MIVNYGGLEMRIVRVLNFERRPVLSDDGVSYLFTRFVINAVGLINAQSDPKNPSLGLGQSVTQGTSAGPFALADAVEPLTNAPLTDTFIRHWMLVPRRTLVVRGAGVDLLRAPLDGMPCDAHSGPTVQTFSIQESLGDSRSFIVHFQATAHLNECQSAEGFRAALLANRFSQHHVVDADHHLNIVTSGTAYFRTDLIHSLGLTPDTLRPLMLHPPVPAYQREHIEVKSNSDGSRVDYSFVDVQKHNQFVAGQDVGATRIALNYRCVLQSDGDLVNTSLDTLEKYYDARWAIQQANSAQVTEQGSGAVPVTSGSGKTTGAVQKGRQRGNGSKPKAPKGKAKKP